MAKKQVSTFEREMKSVSFRKKFEKEYKKFLLSELLIMLMENDSKTVRQLAKEVGLSSTLTRIFHHSNDSERH